MRKKEESQAAGREKGVLGTWNYKVGLGKRGSNKVLVGVTLDQPVRNATAKWKGNIGEEGTIT